MRRLAKHMPGFVDNRSLEAAGAEVYAEEMFLQC
jgi:hypothetical protein